MLLNLFFLDWIGYPHGMRLFFSEAAAALGLETANANKKVTSIIKEYKVLCPDAIW